MRMRDRRDRQTIPVRRFRGSFDRGALPEPRRRARRRVPRSAADAGCREALHASPQRRDEALRRAALTRICGTAANSSLFGFGTVAAPFSFERRLLFFLARVYRGLRGARLALLFFRDPPSNTQRRMRWY